MAVANFSQRRTDRSWQTVLGLTLQTDLQNNYDEFYEGYTAIRITVSFRIITK